MSQVAPRRTLFMVVLVLVLDRGVWPQACAADDASHTAAWHNETRDDAANPAMLWVEDGERLWHEAVGLANKSCASCHGDPLTSMRGVSARYPAVDEKRGGLLNLEGRINACRSDYQQGPPLAFESDDLLGLTALLARQSFGQPINVTTSGTAAAYVATGREMFYRRQGQLNLACADCHERNVGRRLRSDTISPAFPTGYPAYRLEWQALGSLQRRLRACSAGVRAIQFDYGSAQYLSLELYLAVRANGELITAPALRR